MSNQNDKNVSGSDWDSALEKWDANPTSLARDTTPPAPTADAAQSASATVVPGGASDAEAGGAAGPPVAPRPAAKFESKSVSKPPSGFAEKLDVEDNEYVVPSSSDRAVVAPTIPTSGLGPMLDREPMPTKPSFQDAFDNVDADDDTVVVDQSVAQQLAGADENAAQSVLESETVAVDLPIADIMALKTDKEALQGDGSEADARSRQVRHKLGFADTLMGEAPARLPGLPASPPIAFDKTIVAPAGVATKNEVDKTLVDNNAFGAEPLSVRPVMVPAPKPLWTDERSASTYLADNQLHEQWEFRASWIAEEMASCDDPVRRASMMLAVSEMCAMQGDDEKAVAVASAAREMDPNSLLLQRQVRYPKVRDNRWANVLEELKRETGPQNEAAVRAHALAMLALINEHVLFDHDTSEQAWKQLASDVPSDPRSHLALLVQRLNEDSEQTVPFEWPSHPELEPLQQGAHMVQKLREQQQQVADKDTEVGPYEAIGRAKEALRVCDGEAAIRALRGFGSVRGIEDGARWLIAAIAAQSKQTREIALRELDILQSDVFGHVAAHLMGQVAVACSHPEQLAKAMSFTASEAFSDAQRAVIAGLFAQDIRGSELVLQRLLDNESTAVLGQAVYHSLTAVRKEDAGGRVDAARVGRDSDRAAVGLARGIAAGMSPADFGDRLVAWLQAEAVRLVVQLLMVETAVQQMNHKPVADLLSQWGDTGGVSIGLDLQRDRALAAGLIAQLAGDVDEAKRQFLRAIEADPTHEASVRIFNTYQNEGFFQRLSDVAAAAEPARAAVLWLEAAMAAGNDDPAYLELLRQSFQAAPHLLIAAQLGERAARVSGDSDGVLHWIEQRRMALRDPLLLAFDSYRLAMMLVGRDEQRVAELMQQASVSRPSDVMLRKLYERYAMERPEDGAFWRMDQAQRTQGAHKVYWLTQAALECERDGDANTAAKLAGQAVEIADDEVANQCLERCELVGGLTAVLTDRLMSLVKRDDISEEHRCEVQERLAQLDEVGRGDLASALLWHRSILEHNPGYLPSLRRIEQAYVKDGRDADLEPIAAELVNVLHGPEVDAHAFVASRVGLRERDWTSLRPLSAKAAAQPDASLWALRASFAQALAAQDDEQVVQIGKMLPALSDNDMESASILVQVAHALIRLGQHEEASQLLQMALEREPGFLLAHVDLVDVLEKMGEFARAAEECEAVAVMSKVDEHRAELWYRAARLWLDKIDDLARARSAFEQACEIDIAYADVFDRLRSVYTQLEDASALVSLLKRRIDATDDPQERFELEVVQGQALAEVGQIADAKRCLAQALMTEPNSVPALQAYIKVCEQDDDWSEVESSLMRLVDQLPDPKARADVHQQLATIYLNRIPDFQRAEAALRKVLEHDPDNEQAQTQLVNVFRETGEAEKAVKLCSELVERATTPEDKLSRTIQLAVIYEQLQNDSAAAQQMLERMYKQNPNSTVAFGALASFYTRQGQQKPLEMMLDRTSKSAERSLRTGRFSADIFATLQAVAEARGDAMGVRIQQGIVQVLEGGPCEKFQAFGPKACDTMMDDLLAPELVTQPLRTLLRHTVYMLDQAYMMDMDSVRAVPVPPTASHVRDMIQRITTAMDLQNARVLVTPALGPVCVPVCTEPPTVVLGASMLTVENHAVVEFLLIRAFKITQTNACVLSRSAPIDLMPLVAAMIKTITPNYQPVGVDVRRFQEAFDKLSAAKKGPFSPDLPAVALEYAASMDSRVSTLNTAINGWADRAAFLATGDLCVTLEAIAWACGHPSGPPSQGRDRMNWIGRNPEARDTIVFLASDAYRDAYKKLRS